MTKTPRPFVFSTGVSYARDDGRDRQLLEGLATGRREALAELYDRHAASLFRHALALTRQRVEAEDLVQAVFVKLATTRTELLGVRTPVSYLHRMLKTTWIDSERRTITGERAVEHGATGPLGERPPALEDSIDISRALDELAPLQREVVMLHLVEGFSFIEVGRLTGVSLFTAAARYRLAIGRLRKVLTKSGKDRT